MDLLSTWHETDENGRHEMTYEMKDRVDGKDDRKTSAPLDIY